MVKFGRNSSQEVMKLCVVKLCEPESAEEFVVSEGERNKKEKEEREETERKRRMVIKRRCTNYQYKQLSKKSSLTPV